MKINQNFISQKKLLCLKNLTVIRATRKYMFKENQLFCKAKLGNSPNHHIKISNIRRFLSLHDDNKDNKPKYSFPHYEKLAEKALKTLMTETVYLASSIIGVIAYGIAAIPLTILHHQALKEVIEKFHKNLAFTKRYLKTQITNSIFDVNDVSLGERFEQIAQKYNSETMMEFENTKWSYKQAEMLTNKITNYFLGLDYEKGDVVALMITNRPEYVTLVLGLAKIGIVSALIDLNLKNEALLNAILSSDCSAVIVSADISPEIVKIKKKINPKIDLFQLGGNRVLESFTNLSNEIIETPYHTPEIIHKVHHSDPLIYIYSPTNTDMPKLTVYSHYKFLSSSMGIKCLLNLTKYDKAYNPMQLCHYSGLVMGTGIAIVCGIPVVLSRKFIPTNYWSDCIKHNCTVGLYVNDVCRHLIIESENSKDKAHCITKMFGNEVNSVLWERFLNRFSKDETLAQREKNFNIININKEANLGNVLPSFLNEFLHSFTLNYEAQKPKKVVIYNTYQPYIPALNNSGMLNVFERDPFDEFISVSNPTKPSVALNDIANFETETSANLHYLNNFLPTDVNNSSSLFIPSNIELLGKTEDIYSWRGKTIITKEVESIIKIILGHAHCIVYGVPVAGIDGKLGMATLLDLDKTIDLNQFSKKIQKYIPYYACPVLLRIIHQCDDVSSFKLKKLFYAIEGFDPTLLNDKLYYLNRNSGYYETLTKEIYHKIANNKIVF